MKKSIYWILAVLITLAAAYYQRKTGPTHPRTAKVQLDGQDYKFNLETSHAGETDFVIDLETGEGIKGTLFYKRYPTNDDWTEVEMTSNNGHLTAVLPNQPPAGKLTYYMELSTVNDKVVLDNGGDPVIIRFTGSVPIWFMLPHILIMFIAMLLSNLAGLLGIGKNELHRKYGMWALIFLFAGGMILGPIVQKYAFGQLWTGIPFGWDLTDNKTLIAIAFWIYAYVANRKKSRPAITVLASVILLLVYSIPHSMFGSEFDYGSGEVVTGLINWLPV